MIDDQSPAGSWKRHIALTGAVKETERDIQRAILSYLAASNILAWSVPNGAHIAGKGQEKYRKVAALKKDGMTSGAPDLTLVGKKGQVAFIEVKSAKGAVSQDQKHLHKCLGERGAMIAVVRSVDDVKAALREWRWL